MHLYMCLIYCLFDLLWYKKWLQFFWNLCLITVRQFLQSWTNFMMHLAQTFQLQQKIPMQFFLTCLSSWNLQIIHFDVDLILILKHTIEIVQIGNICTFLPTLKKMKGEKKGNNFLNFILSFLLFVLDCGGWKMSRH